MRKTFSCWAGCAVNALALGLLYIATASVAGASLVTFDLEATSVSGGGFVIDPYDVDDPHPGSVIHLNIYAVLHGATINDGVVRVVGNLNDEERLDVGSFSSSNSLAFSGGAGTQPGTQVTAANGSTEIGSEAFWGQGASDATTGNTYFVDASPGGAGFIPVSGTPDAAGDLKLLLGTASYTVSTINETTVLYFFPHLRTDGDASERQNQQFVIGGTQYRLDGSGNDLSSGVSNAFDDRGVSIFTPEPSALGLMALSAIGLLHRRGRTRRLSVG